MFRPSFHGAHTIPPLPKKPNTFFPSSLLPGASFLITCTFFLFLRFLVFCYVSKNTDAHRSCKLSSRRLPSLRRHSEFTGGGMHPSAAQRDALWPLRWHRRRNPERWLTAPPARDGEPRSAAKSSQRLSAQARPQGCFWSPQYPLIMRSINNFGIIIHFSTEGQRWKWLFFVLILSCLTLWAPDSLRVNILCCVFKECCC